ncbi:MAG: ABC transporter permease, partial [Firmicutes bacterium]|nr:ABC transporter permease [Bacillota bacterium]
AVGLWGVPLLGGEALRLPVATWLPLLGVVLCVSFAAVSWALLVATLVRTQEQATILGGVGNILMAALGGIMVPRFVMPSKMQALTQVSPMAWGLDAFHAVLLRSAELSRIAPELTRLLLFGTVALTLAAWIAHRSRS